MTILADVNIPELHERQFLTWTRGAQRRIPLIGLTSKSASFSLSRAQQAGFDRCVAKFHTRQLIAAIVDLCPQTADKKIAWYIPDFSQLATSGTHRGQSASILDQIFPAIAAGQVVVL